MNIMRREQEEKSLVLRFIIWYCAKKKKKHIFHMNTTYNSAQLWPDRRLCVIWWTSQNIFQLMMIFLHFYHFSLIIYQFKFVVQLKNCIIPFQSTRKTNFLGIFFFTLLLLFAICANVYSYLATKHTYQRYVIFPFVLSPSVWRWVRCRESWQPSSNSQEYKIKSINSENRKLNEWMTMKKSKLKKILLKMLYLPKNVKILIWFKGNNYEKREEGVKKVKKILLFI